MKRKPSSIFAGGKENMLPNKRVRKALAPSWDVTSSSQLSSDMSFAIETPVSFSSSIFHFQF